MSGKPLKIFADNRSDPPFIGRFGPVAGATLTGGNWATPLANLQDDELGLVAASRSALPADTRFTVRFTRLTTLRCFWLAHTNLSINARIRLTGYSDLNRTKVVFQVTFDVYPIVGYTETLEWEADNSWTGKPLASDLDGFTQNAFHLLAKDERIQALDVEILDEGNREEFVWLGRLLCMSSVGLIEHYERGGSLGHEPGTTFEKSMSGAEFADVRQAPRIYNVAFNYLDDQQALGTFNAMRRVGTHGDVLVIDDSTPRYLHLLSFLARPLKLPDWQRPSTKFANLDFQLKEKLP